ARSPPAGAARADATRGAGGAQRGPRRLCYPMRAMRAGAYLLPRDDLGRAIALARQADEAGHESPWGPPRLRRGAFLVLGAYAQATRRVALGTGVVPIYPRHPVAMAQEAATLAEISGGRFRLGIGVSHRPSMAEALGLDMGQPLAVMREYVAVV